MRKYIIFQTEPSAEGWRDRKLQHTQALTRILAEHWDSSDRPLPEPGYRPLEFVRLEECRDRQAPLASTHYRPGNWEVVRVETYPADRPGGAFDLIAICHCQYAPIQAPLKPMPDRKITPDSYGENAEANAFSKIKKENSVKSRTHAKNYLNH
ncbi:MAG: hypothetical protein AB4290_24445 [Spirulina sp.]